MSFFKRLLLVTCFVLFIFNAYALLQVNRIDMNQVSVQWDTLPNTTGYKIVYSSANVPFSSTVTAHIKDINFWDMKTNSNEAYYTLTPLDYGSIYNIFIVPVVSNNTDWASATNAITITTRSDYWQYNMLARDDLAIKDLVGVSITSANVSAGDTIMSITPTATDWYITEISVGSTVVGMTEIYLDGILQDFLPNGLNGADHIVYSIPMKVKDGSNLSAILSTGTTGVHYVRIKYYTFNKYGK